MVFDDLLAWNNSRPPRLRLDMSTRDTTTRSASRTLGLPVPARAFVRCGDVKLFGGFVLAVPETVMPGDTDEIWDVEITFVRRLSKGDRAAGLRLDQVMTGPYLSDPSGIESA